MENNKHHIDQLLQEQMQKLPTELNEAHWKDAERRLDEDDKKKRPFVLFFIVAILLVGLGTAAVKKLNNNKKTKQQVAQNQATINHKEQKERIYQQTKEEVLDSREDKQPSSQDKTTATDNMSSAANSQTQNINANSFGSSKTVNQGATNPAQVAKSTSPSNTGPTKTLNSNNANAQPIDKSTTDKQGAINKTNTGVAKTSQPTIKQPKNANTTADNGIATTNKNSKQSSKQAPTRNANNDIGSNGTDLSTSKAVADKAKTKDVRIYRSPEEYQKLNPRYIAGLEGYSFTRSSLSQEHSDSLREIVGKQNAPVVAKKSTAPGPAIFVQDPSSFFIMAGLAAAKGYSGSGDAGTDYGLSPNLGLGYQFNFSERMSLYLTMYMSYISHLNIRETGTNVSYSFDKDSTFVSVTRKNLLQLQVPLQLAYKIRPKHSVYGGLGINLGLNTVSLYEDSKQSSSKKQFGYMNGIRFMDVNVNLGYEYKMSSKLSLGLFYQQGFFDMTKNNYFNNQQNDRNARGGINLRYKFLR